MPLTAMQKSQIRRHLGYENVGFSSVISPGGGGALGTNAGHLASSTYGMLENKMNSLHPCDEAAVTGRAYGSIQLQGLPPEVDDTVTIIFNNKPGESIPLSAPVQIDFTVTSAEAGDLGKLALALARTVSQHNTLALAGFKALAPYGPGSNVLNPMAEFSITNAYPFLVTATSTGAIAAVVHDDGTEAPQPSAQVGKVAGVATIVSGYLPLLNFLYGAIAGATTRLGTFQADVFKARQDEVEARKELYNLYRNDLATLLGIPVNLDSKGGQNNHGAVIL